MTIPNPDQLDLSILQILQKDGRATMNEIGEAVGLSPSPVARRVRLLEAAGIITGYAALIDETALARGLKAGEIAGAGLDVYENARETAAMLKGLPNVVLLPQMGSATVEGRIEMGEKVIINIKTFADGHRPPDQVVPGML